MMKIILLTFVMLSVLSCNKEIPEISEKENVTLSERKGNKGGDSNTQTEKDVSEIEKNIIQKTDEKIEKPTDLASLEKYYASQFKVNKQKVQSRFMQGVYENAGAFLGEILDFDEKLYKPGKVVSKGVDMRRNTFSVTFTVYDVQKNTEYVEITKDFNGFKSVEQLVKDITISPRYELLEIIREALKRKDTSKDLTKRLEGNFKNKKWMHQMDFMYKGTLLELQEILQPYGKDQIIRGSGDYLDVFLLNPQWKLTAASLNNNDFHFSVRLEMVNLNIMQNTTYDFVIKNILR